MTKHCFTQKILAENTYKLVIGKGLVISSHVIRIQILYMNSYSDNVTVKVLTHIAGHRDLAVCLSSSPVHIESQASRLGYRLISYP
jgi:hypothetical protein